MTNSGAIRTLAAVVAAAGVVGAAWTVTGCASGAGAGGGVRFTAVPQLGGVRTADGGRQLVVTYAGGGCDLTPRTRVVETPIQVTVTAAIGTTEGACTGAAYPRVLVLVLLQPFGHRQFRNGPTGAAVPVFDGALLRTPGWLPAGYRESLNLQSPSGAGGWSRVWQGRRPFTDPQLSFTIGPTQLPTGHGTAVGGRYRVRGAPAALFRYREAGRLSLRWTDPAGHASRDLTTTAVTPASAFTTATLTRIADSTPS